LGLNHRKYASTIELAGSVFSIVISVLFASMPVAMYLGWVK
jgi:succinate dehydrogenase / fumarate reductase cytochrome b subunit